MTVNVPVGQPWRDNLIRLSVDCEDSDDIIREFELAPEHA